MAQGTYPSRAEDQLEYWQAMIDWTRRHYEPTFRASQKLIDLYNMQSVTTRESAQEDLNVLEGPGARVKSNLVFGWVEQSMANIAAQNPHFRTISTNRLGIGSDRSVSAISNYWYRETGQLMHDRRVLLDAFLSPYGASKIGWFSEIENEAYNLAIASQGDLIFDDPEQETLAILGGQSPAIHPGQDHVLYIASHTLALQDPFINEDLAILLQLNIEPGFSQL